MGFVYLSTCISILVSVPFMFYKHNLVSRFQTTTYLYGISAYVITIIIKLGLMATFLPDQETEEKITISFKIISAIMLFIIELLDFIGMYWLIKFLKINERGTPLLAFSWGSSESFFSKFLILWIGTLKTQFDWKFLLLAISSNIKFILYSLLAPICWCMSKYKISPKILKPIFWWIVAYVSIPFLDHLSKGFLGSISEWVSLFFQSILTFYLWKQSSIILKLQSKFETTNENLKKAEKF
ncbi:transmembrane protein [Anaeramoeba ignava]|uniref:BOS complex subunit TMEM147 n=1 Tax=Anaeramoeba ignava TaxID=1746090 RepID=A0A9Q0LFX9_ANAIG|nr:transmembrane protein [Anaeramoeba ignava]